MVNHDCTRRDFLAGVLAAGAAAAVGTRPAALRAGEGSGYAIGCYTRPWDKFDYRVALDAIAEAGFKHAGLMTTTGKSRLVISVDTTLEDAQQVGQECRQRGLGIPSVYGGAIPVNKSLEAGIEGLKKLIDNCAAAGAKSLLMGGMGNEKLYDAYFKAIAECCDYAAEKKLEIALKPHGGLNATGPQCRKAIELVGKKNFRLWYDAGNIMYYSKGELDPVKDLTTVNGLVTGWCIKDFQMKEKPEVALTPGTGQVDFVGVLRGLRHGGFTSGPLVVETLLPGEPLQVLAEAKKAREFLEKLVAG